ncbi:MAG: GerMN domain-containing protein [Nitrospirae bacterium]|nr:GerMN domain-containing protein [Nitrospirota bacterium]
MRVLWIFLALALIAASLAAGVYKGRMRLLEQRTQPVLPSAAEGRAWETVNARLFFPKGDALTAEERRITLRGASDVERAGAVIDELLRGPILLSGLAEPLVPSGTSLKGLFIDADGSAYIDLDRSALSGAPKDATGEYLSIQGFYESLRQNVGSVQAVKFLIDGKEIDTLWGHLDAGRPVADEYDEE